MAKLKANTIVRAEDGSYVFLAAGDDVPAWADVTHPDLVDVDDPAPRKRAPRKADDDS
jgi:hypothetical protein